MRIDLRPDADPVDRARMAEGESVVLVIQPGRDPLSQALATAAVAPLAIERAPTMRVNAVVVIDGAAAGDVDAAADFLEGARSTTGQVIEVS